MRTAQKNRIVIVIMRSSSRSLIIAILCVLAGSVLLFSTTAARTEQYKPLAGPGRDAALVCYWAPMPPPQPLTTLPDPRGIAADEVLPYSPINEKSRAPATKPGRRSSNTPPSWQRRERTPTSAVVGAQEGLQSMGGQQQLQLTTNTMLPTPMPSSPPLSPPATLSITTTPTPTPTTAALQIISLSPTTTTITPTPTVPYMTTPPPSTTAPPTTTPLPTTAPPSPAPTTSPPFTFLSLTK